jgi:hypothetical protein
MIAQSVSEYIAANLKNLKVIFISMNGKSGFQYVDRIGETIEGIRLNLDNRLLNVAMLKEQCRRKENLFILGGIESIELMRSFQPDTAVYLLESLEKAFDLIIADAGNDIDNGLAVGALEWIKNRTCIITQHESVLDRAENLDHIYRSLKIGFSTFAVNKYMKDDPYNLKYIEKRLSLSGESLLKVGVSEYDRRAECDRRTLLSYKTQEFCNDLRSISNRILLQACLEPIQIERKKKWMPFT